jgi:hypothetical protein
MRGVVYRRVTPDLTTGAYYRYDMDRLMVLHEPPGRDYFVSVTGQKNPSTVGPQGRDHRPGCGLELFSSGQKGLSKSGLGWVSPTSTTPVHHDPVRTGPTKAQTRNVTFKRLRAGWAGSTLVQAGNILEGCRRFAQGFKKTSSPRSSRGGHLSDTYARIKTLPDQN